MADAQLSSDGNVRAGLLEHDDHFRRLVCEHQALDERIQHLARIPYLTEQQQFDESALKKKKLAVKDRIETIVRERHGAATSATRSQ